MINKPKLLIMVDWFAPGYKAGGPIQSCVNIVLALQDFFDIYVLTTDTDHGETTPYDNIDSNKWIWDDKYGAHIYYAQKKTISTKQLKTEIVTIQADIVYLNHMFSPLFVVYPLLLKWSGKLKSQVVVCPRGALYDSALSVKKYKKTPFLFLFKILRLHKKVLFHATNTREEAAILKYFPGSKVKIADNLPNMNQPSLLPIEKREGELNCIFVARIVSIKNLLFLLTAIENVKATVQLSVIGPIEDEAYWQLCRQKIDRLPSNIQVNYLGTKRNEEVIEMIRQHHLFILPTTGENFGHAIFEAMLAGRPVLISNQTPWLNLQTKGVGWDISLDDSDGFVNAIVEAAMWDQAKFNIYAKATWEYANTFISNPSLKEQYKKLFE